MADIIYVVFRTNSMPLKKVKLKYNSPRTGHEGSEVEYRYSSTLSLNSALNGMGDHRHALDALPPRKTRNPLYRRLGGPQGLSGRVHKISPVQGFDPRTVSP
jgi:hypothetical protein